MKKKKLLIAFAASLLVLVSAFFILQALSDKEWKKGLYFEPQTALYSVNGQAAEFEISGYYVGDIDVASVYREGMITASLVNEKQSLPLHIEEISTIPNEHYYDVDLLLSCELDNDLLSFDQIHISSDEVKGFHAVIDGPIVFQRFDGDDGFIKDDDIVLSYMMAERVGSSANFLYFIENNSTKPLLINSIVDYCGMMQDGEIRVVRSISEDGSIDLGSSIAAAFPMTVFSGETVAFYYSAESDNSRYLFYQPAFNVLYNENEYTLCFPMQSSYPFVYLDDLSVLDLIENS